MVEALEVCGRLATLPLGFNTVTALHNLPLGAEQESQPPSESSKPSISGQSSWKIPGPRIPPSTKLARVPGFPTTLSWVDTDVAGTQNFSVSELCGCGSVLGAAWKAGVWVGAGEGGGGKSLRVLGICRGRVEGSRLRTLGTGSLVPQAAGSGLFLAGVSESWLSRRVLENTSPHPMEHHGFGYYLPSLHTDPRRQTILWTPFCRQGK